MASAFGHGILAYTIKKIAAPKAAIKVTLLAIICSILPDADVLAFKFNIPYEHMFGHRGFTHSIFFSVLFGLLVSFLFHRTDRLKYGVIYILCTLSHAFLDALTTGGRGVAILAPFSEERFFLPWRFIKVSPMSIKRFISQWGIEVLKSEFIYIWVPCLITLCISFIANKLKANVVSHS